VYNQTLTHRIWALATQNANPAIDLVVCLERRRSIGFRYAEVTRSVVIHHGGKDTRVPLDNVRWLHGVMKRCELRILDEEGHGLMASASAMARNVCARLFCISRMIGSTFAAFCATASFLQIRACSQTFPVSREFHPETGSMSSASATTQSRATGEFPPCVEMLAVGGLVAFGQEISILRLILNRRPVW